MKILRFLESFGQELHYYAFDIDDNLFHMPTIVHLEKNIGEEWVPIDLSTSEFAKVRNDKNYRLLNNSLDDAFCEFGDSGPRKELSFLEDMKLAIRQNLFGPSWEPFVKCLEDGSIFALITARGNSSNTYRKAVEYLIDNVLSEKSQYEMYNNCLKHSYLFDNESDFDRIPNGKISQTPLIRKYLDSCDFYGVSSPEFISKFGTGSASNPEKAKEIALSAFIEKCNRFGEKINAKSVSIGFSDDDQKNVDHVDKFFKERSALSHDFSHKMKLNLYNTTNRSIKGGVRRKYEEATFSTQAPGMASSVIPFSKFTSMSSRLFPDKEMDPNISVHNLEVDHLMGISKEIKRPNKRKRKKFKN